jgi:prepilin-type N-terminal cleavage/methylation domain-containing protein
MNTPARRGPNAFTLVELLVVIGIFVLLLLIAVPAFSSMLYSSEESLAENGLRGAITAARDAAARGRQGEDAAAVFFYDASTQKASVIPCVVVGTLADVDATGATIIREVFAPANGFEPVQLPRGFTVRGYAIPYTMDDGTAGVAPDRKGWYEPTAGRVYDATVGNWLFPETDFYDAEVEDDGADRQTFMVRFEGGTGALKAGDLAPVLVLNPAPTDEFRTGAPFSVYRADQAQDKVRFVRGILSAPFTGTGSITLADRRALLGDESSDTVLAKPVRQLGLVNEKKLASALSLGEGQAIRIDRDTGCLYANTVDPMFVVVPMNVDMLNNLMEVRELIPGDPNNTPIPSEARIFTIHRYLGHLQEITGTINGQGVSQ